MPHRTPPLTPAHEQVLRWLLAEDGAALPMHARELDNLVELGLAHRAPSGYVISDKGRGLLTAS